MGKQKILKEPELADRVVSSTGSLLAFKTTYAYSNVSLSYHVDVIGSVSYRESSFFRLSIAYHPHNLSLLFRTNSAGKDNSSFHAKV